MQAKASMNRRLFIVAAPAAAAELARAQRRGDAAVAVPDVIKNLKPMLDGVQPITGAERAARIEKARRLMRDNKIGAILCQAGSSLYYYTGMRATSATSASTWVLPAKGDPASFEPEA